MSHAPHSSTPPPRPRGHRTTLWATLLLAGNAFAEAPAVSNAALPIQRALEQGLRPSMLKMDEPLPGWSLKQRLEHYHVPGVAIAVLKDGKVIHAAGFGLREADSKDAVDADTLFSVGSVSKVVASAATLRHVASGKLDLDRDVNTYLTSWKVHAAPAFTRNALTLRMLMSHTSGLTVWGFEDYQPDEKLPTLVQTLDGVKPAKNEPVRIDFEPGTRMRYSGGAVTVEQLVLEDTQRKPLEALARAEVFQPIGMRRSTYVNPVPVKLGNIAKAHDKNGQRVALPRGYESFPEQAASGLWTSANDLGAFVGTLIASYQGKNPYLPRPLAVQMMTEVSPSHFGLGPRLAGDGPARVFHHGGSNDSYRAWIEGYLETGDGLVVLTNGTNGTQLATEIRNAISDALGRGNNPVLRTVTLPAAALADFTGTFRWDKSVPHELAGNLSAQFESDTLEFGTANGVVTAKEGNGPAFPLHALTPTRFVTPGDALIQLRIEFLRNAHGTVKAVRVDRGSGTLLFRREEAPASKP
ncbi:serine hydrolase domain-containing protein [Myxococcus landrumensis]|uniref:Beta-lactamase family protein n=1 Tax=Myxococcus landrumensis TaxID=2813577 RepID=A0ABX7N5Y1_9BACT|nr:serine hydrolase domain-containing protein [Myxococcus landrumus]QSQ13087.1 beta-lactamase family protein [Myxococcus landrumus]